MLKDAPCAHVYVKYTPTLLRRRKEGQASDTLVNVRFLLFRRDAGDDFLLQPRHDVVPDEGFLGVLQLNLVVETFLYFSVHGLDPTSVLSFYLDLYQFSFNVEYVSCQF